LYTIGLEAIEDYDRQFEPIFSDYVDLCDRTDEQAKRRIGLLQTYLVMLANRGVSQESALRPHAALRDARRLVALLDPWTAAVREDGTIEPGRTFVAEDKLPYSPDTALFRLATAHASCGTFEASIRIKLLADARRKAADIAFKATSKGGEDFKRNPKQCEPIPKELILAALLFLARSSPQPRVAESPS